MRSEALLTDENLLAWSEPFPSVEQADRAAQLRADAACLLRRGEREKSQIARDLHDGLAQSLTALSLELSIWKTEINTGRSLSPQDILQKIAELAKQLGGAINCTQAVSGKLRSRVLEEFGLSAALASYLETLEQRTGVVGRFSSDSEVEKGETSPFLAAQIYQLAVEVIEGRAQAGTRSLRVQLLLKDDVLVLVFKDDGAARVLTPEMVARVRLLGGLARANDNARSLQITLPIHMPA